MKKNFYYDKLFLEISFNNSFKYFLFIILNIIFIIFLFIGGCMKGLKSSKFFLVLKIFLILIIFALIFIFYEDFLNFFNFSNDNTNNTNTELNSSNSEQLNNSSSSGNKLFDVNFSLVATGDILCHNTQYFDAYISSTGEYDFNYVFENVVKYIEPADIAISSLETTFAGKDRGYSNYPTFNSPDSLITAVKNAGVDIISTAGNHCLDYGFSGLSRTIDVLDEADISHIGTYKTQEERDTILTKYVKGVKIAFINYTYGTNGIPVPDDKPFCVNLIDKDLISKDIESAKSQNADIIVACMHWGTEYRTTANDEQKELADFLFQNGVDIILGNHPHTLEPMEKRTVTLEDGSTKDGFIIYALGNFICDQNSENTRNSIILNLTITKKVDGTISIDKAEYTPIYMYKNSSLSIKKMKLLDIEKTLSNYESGLDTSIGQNTYSYLKEQLEKIKNIVGEEIV